MEKKVIWGAGSNQTTQFMHRYNPNIPLLFSLRQLFLLYAKYYTGLLPFLGIKEKFLEIPIISSSFRAHAFGQFGHGRLARFALGVLHFLITRKRLFRHLQKRGIKVILWVANTDEDFDTAFNVLGADGVMTDFPSRLTKYLARRNNPLFTEIIQWVFDLGIVITPTYEEFQGFWQEREF